ncbi:MAG: sulfotransferase domain-containing protein [Proteobacteria bacterium]|nr:sulfotransferase domain-containing protein [Pseudomonadota bacterium]
MIRSMLPYYRACLRRPPAARLLFVDPIAAFSAEWLHRRFGYQVVILWRHPAAFVASLKRLGWRFDFSNWLDQPALMRDHLADLVPHFYAEHDLIAEGAWVWRSIYQVLQTFQQRNPDFISLRHEDLSTAPERVFRRLFERLDLSFTEQVGECIRETSSALHPVDGPPGSYDHLQRHSAALVGKWGQQLTPDEVERIYRITEPVAHLCYPVDAW